MEKSHRYSCEGKHYGPRLHVRRGGARQIATDRWGSIFWRLQQKVIQTC